MAFNPAAKPGSGMTRFSRAPSALRSAVIGAVVLLLGLIVFRDFVFGNLVLLYTDIGSDSLNVFYPNYVLFSDYLRQIGIPSWSFEVGMGQNLFPFLGTLFLTPVVWLAKGLIAKALIYQHLAYAVVAGVLFAHFLARRGLDFVSCLLGALLLSFSAYMCMGSTWSFHALELLCLTGLLFATEEALTVGRWWLLALAVAVVAMLGAFHLYLGALLLCFYVPTRIIERDAFQPVNLLRISALLAGAAVLGVGLSGIVTVNSLYALVNSPRGLGPASRAPGLITSSVFGLESPLHYVTAALRPFANDLLGTGSAFRGWRNYLEAPMTYCGLISLLLLPQAFVKTSRRQWMVYSVFLFFAVAPTVFPWFRYLFWAFQGNYYRTFSLFSVFGVITLAMTAFSRYISTQRLNLWILAVTALLLVAVLYLPFGQMQEIINRALRLRITILLLGYTGVLAMGQLFLRQRLAAYMVVALVAGELIYFDGLTVADRPTVTKQELTEKIGYNDETVDAIRDLHASDKSFFRLTKTYFSGLGIYGSVNDAMVFGYYGTSSYSSFNNLNYIKFLMAVDVVNPEILGTDTKWSLGLLGHPILSTFAGEKYVLTEDPVPFQASDDYELMRSYGKKYLFRNRLALPLGLTFRQYLPEELFLQLSTDAKARVLLHAVVASNEVAERSGLKQLTLEGFKDEAGRSIGDIIAERRSTGLELRSFAQTRMEGSLHLEQKSILVVQTPFDPGWSAYQDGQPVPVFRVDFGLLGAVVESGQHTVELRYRPPFLFAGAAISLASLLIMAAGIRRWPQLPLPS
jgi:uncharacterized membrane protein YfhO